MILEIKRLLMETFDSFIRFVQLCLFPFPIIYIQLLRNVCAIIATAIYHFFPRQCQKVSRKSRHISHKKCNELL